MSKKCTAKIRLLSEKRVVMSGTRNAEKASMTFRMGELFCGPGGLAYGATRASCGDHRIVHAWATDYDQDACRTYAVNICGGDESTIVCGDIRALEFDRLMAISPVEALAFGFPCNDFSGVGEQKGTNGDFGPLYHYCSSALMFFKPLWFVAENVSGLTSANEGRAFSRILNDFSDCGYRLYPHLYKFEEYGVPQRRHRVVIVGIRADQKYEFKIPAPRFRPEKFVTVSDALCRHPIMPDAANHELTRQSAVVIERLKHIRPGQNAFNADLPPGLRLNVRGATISQIYRRLAPDRPAYTITGSGGGGTHVYHWKEPRALTNRERARLQSFPDHYRFEGAKERVRRQIGMAVPPLAAKVIFEAILKSFAGIPYKSVSANLSCDIQLPFMDIDRTRAKAKCNYSASHKAIIRRLPRSGEA